jgi:hypothetical protein
MIMQARVLVGNLNDIRFVLSQGFGAGILFQHGDVDNRRVAFESGRKTRLIK